MSQFSASRQTSGPPQDQQQLSIFSPPESHPKQHVSVSNLTKNLMSRPQQAHDAPPPIHHISGTGDLLQRNPPLYSASASSSHARYLPGESASSNFTGSLPDPTSASTASSFTQSQGNFFSNNGGSSYPNNGNMNYIPLGHNTPTAVLSSYTSKNSYTPSFHSASGQQDQAPQYLAQSGFLSSSYTPAPGNPTTTVSMDSANPNLPLVTPSSLYRNTLGPALFKNADYFAHLLSNSSTNARSMHPSLPRLSSDSSVTRGQIQGQNQNQNRNYQNDSTQNQTTQNQSGPGPDSISIPGQQNAYYQPTYGSQGGLPQESHGSIDLNHASFLQTQANQPTQLFLPTEPDHYMTYKEYLDVLNKRDANELNKDTGYDEHLNIVEYPVNELITMLACLLTKIIEANDKLHPNHFENTIAIRQKLKEQKKIRRMHRQQESDDDDDMNTTTSHDDTIEGSSDDEEDELKNRYLANVLAFHGTNIPGISLHAYLTRVLKYCPVTNEVFLSLLVYFDRIAKKANNLRKKKKEDEENDDSEQLFVMDSYNIHRLIILGITVSSKFFSDIFYKNLRYAKVGGLPLEELNYLELQFLLLLDFKLMISVEDLQNYGDLLLKFWKREQLTNELVNTAKSGEPSAISGQ